MSLLLSIFIFITGLVIVIYFAEMLIKGVVGTSINFNISAFVLSVVFIGFDPENLFVGSSAAHHAEYSIAIGSVIGAAMVAIALAFGITALVAPMKFKPVSNKVLAVPSIATILPGIFIINGSLSRFEGIILVVAYIFSIRYLFLLNKKGISIQPSGEVAETLEKPLKAGRVKSVLRLIVALASIIIGSEMIVDRAQVIIIETGIEETFFGLVILSLLISIEELAREIPAALKGRGDISFGNVMGSVLAFFLFNAGIISIIHPIKIDNAVIYFLYPICIITVAFILYNIKRQKLGRIQGLILLLLYLAFALVSYFIG